MAGDSRGAGEVFSSGFVPQAGGVTEQEHLRWEREIPSRGLAPGARIYGDCSQHSTLFLFPCGIQQKNLARRSRGGFLYLSGGAAAGKQAAAVLRAAPARLTHACWANPSKQLMQK